MGLTAYGSKEFEKNCLTSGMKERVVKPLTLLNLENVFSKYYSQSAGALVEQVEDEEEVTASARLNPCPNE